jgi:hypothetical protein
MPFCQFKSVQRLNHISSLCRNVMSVDTTVRKRKQNDGEDDPQSMIPTAPTEAKDRIEGTHYLYKEKVTKWLSGRWICVHGKRVSTCLHCRNAPRLLSETHPHLVTEWDCEKNGTIQGVRTGSNKKVTWRCPSGHVYEAPPNSRTRASPTGCKICHVCVHDPLQKKQRLDNFIPTKHTTATGDASEQFLAVPIRLLPDVQDVQIVGPTSDETDLVVSLKLGIQVSIQVKTMTLRRDGTYSFSMNKRYPDQMLIVAVDKERLHYFVSFAKETSNTTMQLSFDRPSKYDNMKFSNLETCMTRIADMLPHTLQYQQKVSSECAKELQMLDRVDVECQHQKLGPFQRNTTNGTPIDGFIKTFSIQAKFVSFPVSNSRFEIRLCKYGGMLDGRRVLRPYAEDDFEFLIIEVGGTRDEPTRFHGHFCVIPKAVLIERGVLKTDTQPGKEVISIRGPGEEYWAKEYWNNWGPLKQDRVKLTLSQSIASPGTD